MSYEEKLAGLKELVSELENKELPLEDAIKKYEEAIKLSKECYKMLNDATNAVTNIENEGKEELKGDE